MPQLIPDGSPHSDPTGDDTGDPALLHVENDASATMVPKCGILQGRSLGGLSAKLNVSAWHHLNTAPSLATRESGRVNPSRTHNRRHFPNRERLSEHTIWSSIGLIDIFYTFFFTF